MRLRRGVHRAVARDGAVALVTVSGGVVVDIYRVGSIEAQPEATMRWLAPSLGALRERNENRLRDAVFDELVIRRVFRGTLKATRDGGAQVDTEEFDGEEGTQVEREGGGEADLAAA